VAVVTGASRGIGKATADLLREQGVMTFGISQHIENTDWTRQCDVRDEDSVSSAFRELVSTYGQIDILVNCAGVVSTKGPLDLSVQEWETVLGVNLIGTYLCCKHAILNMRSRQYGKIVNVSSIAGRSHSRTASVAYTCSKYGVIGVTRQLAATFGKEGININCVAPSQTMSEMLMANIPKEQLDALASSNPLGRLSEPREVAQTICFLTSDAASYINGAVIDVNGGQL
jgi:3-oxoacyl-[acyl-carrier protein] reductase